MRPVTGRNTRQVLAAVSAGGFHLSIISNKEDGHFVGKRVRNHKMEL